MNFTQATRHGFTHYATIGGRASRSEYWYWGLFCALGGIIASMLDMAVFHIPFTSNETHPIYTIFLLVTLLPNIGVTVRRFHDMDYRGWWLLLAFIPLIGILILLIWSCRKGTTGANRFGPDPLLQSIS